MRRAILAVAIVGAFATLIALGTWQVQRLAWKEALIANATARPSEPTVAAPGPEAWANFSVEDWRYRRVRLSGRFAPAEARVWFPLTDPNGPLGGPGYAVLAPFVSDEGWAVMVNRGFVPEAKADPASRPASAPAEERITIEGLVRRDDPPSFATPSPDLGSMTFFARDIGAIGAALGVTAPLAPYQVDLLASATPPGGLPQAGESRIAFANNHLQYAITWYGLAATLVGVVGAALWRRRREVRS